MGDLPEEHGIRAEIDGQRFSLFVDYDRPRLANLSDNGRLEYFRRRFELVVLEPLAVLLEEHDHPRHRADHEAAVLLLWGNAVMCAIEALGHFLTPSTSPNSEAFLTFVNAFMDPAWRARPEQPPPGVDSYGRWLWDSFRNGLAHSAYVKDGGFEPLGGRLYRESEAGLKVDQYALDIDLRSGVKKMHHAVSTPDNYFRSTFLDRFGWTYIQGEA